MKRWILILLIALATLLLLAAVFASPSEDGPDTGPLWRAATQVLRLLGLIARLF